MAETTLKTLIDRFRSRPEWQDPDPAVRAEAVLRLPAADHDLVLALAREDADARVRRAAVKRLSEVPVLGEIAGADADAGVREEAAGRLVHLALHDAVEAQARAAVAGLREAKHLASVARGAAHASVREAALDSLADPKLLASVVREALDPRTRLLALGRIEDGATLLGLAQNLEQKALAVAAVDRLSDPDALKAVADKARVPAASRRARARLETGEPAVAPAPARAVAAPVPGDDEAERRAYEHARAALEREAATAREREAAALAAREAEARGEVDQALLARREALAALVAQAEALDGADLAAAQAAFRDLETSWRESASGVELPELGERWQAVASGLRSRAEAERAELAQKERAHVDALAALARRAEAIVATGARATLRDTDHALREIKDALAHPGHFPSRRERDQLLARLETARRQLYPLLQQLREDVEWKRFANVSVQEDLAARAEALVSEPNLDRAASVLHELDQRWKLAKEAPKDQGDALWTRFKAARDQVKAKVDAFLAKQAEEHAHNLAKKQALCEKAEALAESSDWVNTAEALRVLQAEWKAIGPVPRAVSQRVWERFRKPCDRFFTRFSEHRGERSKEWEQNLAKKEALCEKAEALAASQLWEEAAAGIKQLQTEWRAIGPVKKSRAEAVWQRFRAACDLFFDRYKNRDAHAREAAREARERICAELEALAPADAPPLEPPEDLVARVQAAQTAWRQAGGLPQDELAAFDARFLRARDLLLEQHPRAFQGSDLDPEASRRRAEKLATRVEELLDSVAPKAASAAVTASDLAARLRDALASNTIGGREAVEQRWSAAASELETAQSAWKRLGPLPGAEGRALVERFEQACRRFLELRPRSSPGAPSPAAGATAPRRSRAPPPPRAPAALNCGESARLARPLRAVRARTGPRPGDRRDPGQLPQRARARAVPAAWRHGRSALATDHPGPRAHARGARRARPRARANASPGT